MISATEVLRRIYHDLAKRRTRVLVSPARPVRESKHPPIFLVGVYRSGTTLLRYVLDSHSQICCPPETSFLATLSPLLTHARSLHGFESLGFDRAHVTQQTRDFVLYFFQNHAAAHAKRRWSDKSPNFVDHLETLHTLFPEAQFVMLYRNGLDQAHSMTRGGTHQRPVIRDYCRKGEDLRIGAIRYWSEKTGLMLDFEKRHPEVCHSITYEGLCTDPERVLKALFYFLGETWEPAVLEFYKFPHDRGAEDGRVMASRGFSIRHRHYLKWPPDLVESCRGLGEERLSALGYII